MTLHSIMTTPRLLGSKIKGDFMFPLSTWSRLKHSHYAYGSLKHAAACVQICRKFRQNSQRKTVRCIENYLKKIRSNTYPDIVRDPNSLFHRAIYSLAVPTSSYNFLSSDSWDRYSHKFDKNESDSDSKRPEMDENESNSWGDGGDGGDGGEWSPMKISFLLFSIGLIAYATKSSLHERREISWPVFLRLMLRTGEVQMLTVSAKRKTVTVNLRPGAVINGEQITPSSQRYYFTVGDVQTFEEKLIEAQRDLGIKPSDYVPVKYEHVDNAVRILGVLFVLGVLGLLIFAASKTFKFGVGGSSLNPFTMTRAKTTIIIPGSKKGIVSMKDVAGMKEAKEEIREFIEFLKDPQRFKELGAKMPKGALLTGPPGTGKTLLAKAVSTEAGVPFISMAGSDFVEMIGGLGAARVRDLFKQAHEHKPCIIFIDEIDAIGRTRSGSNNESGGDSEHDQTLNQLLVEMDGMNTATDVIMLASTNRSDILDNALLRPGRFDRNIEIHLPTLPERREIFEVYLRKLKLGRKEDMFEYYAKRLAELTPGKSGADIASICNEAAIHAARTERSSVDQENFEYAIERVIAGLKSRSNPLSPEERKQVAYHEAGHVIVSWMLKHTEPVIKISTVPRSNSPFGFTQKFPFDRKLQTNEELFDVMCTLLGGRVSESLVLNRVTTGAEDDLKRVTDMAYQQIVTFGMNKRVGPISFPVRKPGEMSKKLYGDKLAHEIDEEASLMIAKAHKVTGEILVENRDKLDTLASALLTNEVLNYEDLVNLIGQSPHGDKMKKHYANQFSEGDDTGSKSDPAV